jgi:hypothetical protein
LKGFDFRFVSPNPSLQKLTALIEMMCLFETVLFIQITRNIHFSFSFLSFISFSLIYSRKYIFFAFETNTASKKLTKFFNTKICHDLFFSNKKQNLHYIVWVYFENNENNFWDQKSIRYWVWIWLFEGFNFCHSSTFLV